MEKVITHENLRSFSYVNDHICSQPIKGIVIYFYGFGCCDMFRKDLPEGIKYGEKGILYVVPYNQPWAWMNQQAQNYPVTFDLVPGRGHVDLTEEMELLFEDYCVKAIK